MPFDEGNEDHGGGGDDDRHTGLEDIADMAISVLVFVAKLEGKCVSCAADDLAIKLMSKKAEAIMQRDGEEKAVHYLMDMIAASGKEAGINLKKVGVSKDG